MRSVLAAATVFLAAVVLTAAGQRGATPPARVAVPSDLVPIQVVLDRPPGAVPLPRLTADDFRVVVDGRPVPIAFFSDADEPVTAVLLIDGTTSFLNRYGALLMRNAVDRSFLPGLRPGDRACIASIVGEVAVTTPCTGDRVALSDMARRALGAPVADQFGPSPVWDGLDAAVTALAAEPGRRVIIALTDGRSTGNRQSYRDVAVRAMAAGIAIHIISQELARAPNRVWTSPAADPEAALRFLADATGGIFRADSRVRPLGSSASSVGLSGHLARTTTSLHEMYTLGIRPERSGTPVHALEVLTTVPGATVLARKGFLTRTD